VFRLGPKAHSTFTVNGQEHFYDGKAVIEDTFDDAQGTGAKMNLTAVFEGQLASAYRTVKLMGDDFYVIDEVTALSDQPAEVEWRMMTLAGVTVNDDNIRLTGSNGVNLDMTAAPDNEKFSVKYVSWPASGQYAWETENKGCRVAGFTYTVPSGESVTITVKLSKN
jgi:hypothetical protein